MSPLDRVNEVDYTLFNSTRDALSIIYLPLKRFVRNLQVLDEDGSRLNFAPNSQVQEAMEELKRESPDTYDLLVQRFKHADYRLAVLLPNDRAVNSGETRTFRISYESEYPARYFPFWNWISRHRSFFGMFFNIPLFKHEISRHPGHSYDHFNVTVGPPGYSVRGKSNVNGVRPEKLYENGFGDNSRVTQARLPPPEEKSYTWGFVYRLVPARTTLMWILVLFLVFGFLAGFGGLFLAINPGSSWAHQSVRVISAGFLTATVAIVVSYHDSWLDRYKLLSALMAVLHVVVWILDAQLGAGMTEG